MPSTRPSIFCTVRLTDGKLRIRLDGEDRSLASIKTDIDEAKLRNECSSYWKWLELKIGNGSVTGNPRTRTNFFEDAKARGAALCRLLMKSDDAEKLWNYAKASDQLIIVMLSPMPHIPWEALFCSERQRFLSDCCIVRRQPEPPDGAKCEPDGQCSNGFDRDYAIYVDSALIDWQLAEENKTVADWLAGHGEAVDRSYSLSGLMKSARMSRVFHLICEHDKSGLRVAPDVFYSIRHSDSHRFSRDTVLVIGACKNGPREEGDDQDYDMVGMAASIATFSSCTVLAPLSVVTIDVCARLAQRMNAEIRRDTGPLTIGELWRRVRTESEANEDADGHVTAARCFSLWYGLYGSANTPVRKPI